jgi:hypothetical protein
MSLGQLLGGAGVVGQAWRAEEDAQRASRARELQTEELNRLEALRRYQQQTQTGAPQDAAVPQFTLAGLGEGAQFASDQPAAPAPAAPAAPGLRMPAFATQYAALSTPAPATQQAPAPQQAPAQQAAATAPQTPTNVGRGASKQSAAKRAQLLQEAEAAWEAQLADRPPVRTSRGARPTPESRARVAEKKQFIDTYIATASAPKAGLNVPESVAAQPAPQPAPQPALQATAPRTGGTRTDRLNNPGGLVYNEYTRSLGATGKDYGGLAIFPSMEIGAAASLANLQNYGRNGFNTVEKIINRWAPPNAEGNTPESTRNYINFVSQQLGVNAEQPLDMQNPATLQALNGAIKQFEGTGEAPAPLEIPRTQERNMEMADFYLSDPETIPYEQQQLVKFAQQQAELITRQRNEDAQLAQMYIRSGTAYGAQQAGALREAIRTADMQLLQLQQQFEQKAMYLEGMQGIQEFATANDPRRLSGVLTAYLGRPVGIQRRPDGNYNYFVNGNKTKENLTPAQMAELALRVVSPEARQAAAESAKLENELALKFKYDTSITAANIRAIANITTATTNGEYALRLEELKKQGITVQALPDGQLAVVKDDRTLLLLNPTPVQEKTPLGSITLAPRASAVDLNRVGR